MLYRRLVFGGLAAFVAGWIVVFLASTALAYTRDYECSLRPQATYYFANSGFTGAQPWTATLKTDVQVGATSWNSFERPDTGASYMSATEVSSPTSGTLDLYNVPSWKGNSWGGTAYCFTLSYIVFDFDDTSDPLTATERRGLVAHEFGHGHGIHHSGDGDSIIQGLRPTMSTCNSKTFLYQKATPDIDDWANLSHRFWHTEVVANSSFEMGEDPWNISGGVFDVYSGGAQYGTYWGQFNNAYGGYIYNSARMWNHSGNGFRPSAWLKKVSTSTEGNVSLLLRARRVDAPTTSASCAVDSFISNWDINAPIVAGYTTVSQQTVTPGNSFVKFVGPYAYPPSGAEGYDAELRIYSYLHPPGSPGVYRALAIDRAGPEYAG